MGSKLINKKKNKMTKAGVSTLREGGMVVWDTPYGLHIATSVKRFNEFLEEMNLLREDFKEGDDFVHFHLGEVEYV